MKMFGGEYSKAEILAMTGSDAQCFGTRRYVMDEGRARGTACIDADTGPLRFTLVPDRGLDISRAACMGCNLVYQGPAGEAHPSYFDPSGAEWLRGFFGGLLTTCGVSNIGAPCSDGEDLGLHGRYSHTPAAVVNDLSRWEGDEYSIEIEARFHDEVLFGPKLMHRRTVRAKAGDSRVCITDETVNKGGRAEPFNVLYHINAGFPLLSENSIFGISPCRIRSYDGREMALEEINRCIKPSADFSEENYLHAFSGDTASAILCNPGLMGGVALYVGFDPGELPYLNLWRMFGVRDYVLAMEPANSPCEARSRLRERGVLPHIGPGETRKRRLEIGVLRGMREIGEYIECHGIQGIIP
jgi:hypothetical protein